MFHVSEEKVITFADAGPDERSFSTKREFTALVESLGWSKGDVTAVWNATFGAEKTVKMFRNRPYGIDRIWEAIQKLKTKPAGPITSFINEPKERKARKSGKRSLALELLRRENGASGDELQNKLGWLPHTVRGFISTLQSKYGIKVDSEKTDKGRVYKVPA